MSKTNTKQFVKKIQSVAKRKKFFSKGIAKVKVIANYTVEISVIFF